MERIHFRAPSRRKGKKIHTNTQNWFLKRKYWPNLPRRGHPKSQYGSYNWKNCQVAVDKCWSVWNHDEPNASWHSRPRRTIKYSATTSGCDKQKQNNLNTIDAIDDIAQMCNNYKKQMPHDLPLYMCGVCGMRQFVKPKVRDISAIGTCTWKILTHCWNSAFSNSNNMIPEMISPKKLSSVYASVNLESNGLFYIHPETMDVVEINGTRVEKAYVCGGCWFAIKVVSREPWKYQTYIAAF